MPDGVILRLRPGALTQDALAELGALGTESGVDLDVLVEQTAVRVVLVGDPRDVEAGRRATEAWCRDRGLPIDGVERVRRALRVQRVLRGDPLDAAPAIEERLAAFVTAVRAAEQAWGLYETRWARSTAIEGREALPFWPSRQSAAACCVDAWATCSPRAISRDDLVGPWLVGMEEDEIVAVVWPTPTDDGVPVPASVLGARLAGA